MSRLVISLLVGTLMVSHAVQAAAPAVSPETVSVPSQVLALPGSLDSVPMLNSNNPEVVQTEGVLTSTLSPNRQAASGTHLSYSFTERFDIFAHHIAKADPVDNLSTLYLGILLHNPGTKPAHVEVLSAASYLSQPDAPFVPLPAVLDNAGGKVFAGPGDRVTGEVLRGNLQKDLFPESLEVEPGATRLFVALPIPVKGLTPPLNGRSLLARLKTDQPVQAATVAMFARPAADGTERAPQQSEWLSTLNSGTQAGPRDKTPTKPDSEGAVIYGRVAGVQEGSTWTGTLTNSQDGIKLNTPQVGKSISFPISSVSRGTFGTGQVQSAPLLVRTPDTAYAAHGNYGVKYDLRIPLINNQKADLLVLIKLQSPLKSDERTDCLRFYKQPSARVFFRGTIKTAYVDSQNIAHEKYTHLVQHQGEPGTALVAQYLKPKEARTVKLEFYYPADATPPQVVTVESLDADTILE